MKHLFLFSICILMATIAFAQPQQTNAPAPQTAAQPQQRQQQVSPESSEWYYPVPPKIQPGVGTKPPSDAIILFDGTDLSKWVSRNGEAAKWQVQNGELIIAPGTGSINTKEYFGDCQLHIEFKSPAPEQHNGQNRGNSGIMLQSKYEIQVLDCDNNPTYVNGMVGSVYKQSAPSVNAYM